MHGHNYIISNGRCMGYWIQKPSQLVLDGAMELIHINWRQSIPLLKEIKSFMLK